MSLATYGQSLINKNLYMVNPVTINPGQIGNNGSLFVGLQSSMVNENELGLPSYTSLNIHSSLKGTVGIGGVLLLEKQGDFSFTTADFGASYRIELPNAQRLRFGLTIGLISQSLNTSSFKTNSFVDQTDPFLTSDLYNQTFIKLGSGLVYQNGNLEIGLGSPYLFNGGESFNKEANVTASYTWILKQNDFKLNPYILYQIKETEVNLYDLNVRGIYTDNFWALLGYRSNRSMNFAFGATIKSVDLGYNFNSAMSNLKEINSQNHEIFMAFKVRKN